MMQMILSSKELGNLVRRKANVVLHCAPQKSPVEDNGIHASSSSLITCDGQADSQIK